MPRTQLTCFFGGWASIWWVKSSKIWVIWGSRCIYIYTGVFDVPIIYVSDCVWMFQAFLVWRIARKRRRRRRHRKQQSHTSIDWKHVDTCKTKASTISISLVLQYVYTKLDMDKRRRSENVRPSTIPTVWCVSGWKENASQNQRLKSRLFNIFGNLAWGVHVLDLWLFSLA